MIYTAVKRNESSIILGRVAEWSEFKTKFIIIIIIIIVIIIIIIIIILTPYRWPYSLKHQAVPCLGSFLGS